MKRSIKNLVIMTLCMSILLFNQIEVKANNLNHVPYTFNELQPDLILLTNSINVSTDNIGKEVTISIPMQVNISVNLSDRGYDGFSYMYNIETSDKIGIKEDANGYRVSIPNDAIEGDSYDIKLTLCYMELQVLSQQPYIIHPVSEIPPVESEIFTINIINEKNQFPSVSDNNIPKVEPQGEMPVYVAPTEEEIHAMKAAEIEARQKKVVTTASGATVKTEIAGVYEVKSLNGTAVRTPKADVQKAIGLSEEEIAQGTNASIYMSDYVSKEDRELLNNVAAENGKNVLSMMISDLYSITKDGVITKLNSSKEPVSLLFGIPKNVADANRIYSILCITADGNVVELKDIDNDPNTITVETTVFGKYVIVY